MDKLREFVRDSYNKAVESEKEKTDEFGWEYQECDRLNYVTGSVAVKIEEKYGINADDFLEFVRYLKGRDSIDCYLYKQYNQCDHGVEYGHYCPECL